MIEEKEIKKIIEKTPDTPGVYKMLDENTKIIYIGKAKSLKKRVQQYFQKNYQHSTRTKKLLEKLSNIEVVTVDSELEAMILENNLIKEHQPKYNVIMKDDKNYVYIKITDEDFPRVQIVRQLEKDKAKYFGPKTAAHKVKETFKVLKKIFPFRHCGLDIDFVKTNAPKHQVKVTNKVLKYPCLDYYIKRCIAPCIGQCTPEEYREIIKNIERFLEGKADDILKSLNEQMVQHAKNREFEKAAKIRDKIQKVEDILEKQKVQTPTNTNQDIINYLITHNRAYFNLFQIRDGKLIGQENFILSAETMQDNENAEEEETLYSFLNQYYQIATDLPKEILIPHEISSQKEFEELLARVSGKKIKVMVPQKGDKNKLLEMSLNNARIYADRHKPSWQKESEFTENAVKELQKLLGLKAQLKRIECYDISHLSGTETVGSMVVFKNGVPKKDHYRKFKLRTVQGKPDDYKSMEEVLYRRFIKISQQFKYKDYKFKKATKADLKQMEKEGNFYLLEIDKKICAQIEIKEINEKVTLLNSLEVKAKERGKKLGQFLIKKSIEKTKGKRIYIFCKPELREYYELIGFEETKKVPKELEDFENNRKKENPKTLSFAYDKLKHKKDQSFEELPDLIIIDGGKGQLQIANKLLDEFEMNVPHISLAKRLEEIFIPGKKDSINLPENHEALKLLQRARNEAHRFAITYNRQLRSKKLNPKRK